MMLQYDKNFRLIFCLCVLVLFLSAESWAQDLPLNQLEFDRSANVVDKNKNGQLTDKKNAVTGASSSVSSVDASSSDAKPAKKVTQKEKAKLAQESKSKQESAKQNETPKQKTKVLPEPQVLPKQAVVEVSGNSSSTASSSSQASEEVSSIKISKSSRSALPRSARLVHPSKSPLADPEDENYITTAIGWKKSENGGCAESTNPDVIRSKAAALRQLLYRFTGSDDYHSTYCQDSCDNVVDKPLLSGLALNSNSGVAFNIIVIDDLCHYQLIKPSSGNWAPLLAAEAICTCFSDM